MEYSQFDRTLIWKIQHEKMMQVKSISRATSSGHAEPTHMNGDRQQVSNAVPQLLTIKKLQIMNLDERPSSVCQRMSSMDSIASCTKLVVERLQSEDSIDKLLEEMMESDNVTSVEAGRLGISASETQAGRSGLLKKHQRQSFILWAAQDGLNSSDFDDDIDYANIFHNVYETSRNYADRQCQLPLSCATVPDEPSSLVMEALAESQKSGSNKRKKPTEVQGDAVKCYITGKFTDVDVLLGRGGRVNQHPGNQAYLQEKERMQDRYFSTTKDNKKEISQELVDWVHARGGRFLKQDDDKRWYDVNNTDARKKASQTLRELNTSEHNAYKRARYENRKLGMPNNSRQ